MGAVSTFFNFFSLSGLILRMAASLKNFYYKGLNSFTLRQFSNKINTTVFSTTVICLMLFITICLLSACLTLKNSMNENIKRLVPVDITLKNFRNMDHLDRKELNLEYGYTEKQIENSHFNVLEKLEKFDFDILKHLKEYSIINMYATSDLTLNHTLGSELENIRKEYPFLI